MCLTLSIYLYALQNVHTTSEIYPESMMVVNASKKHVKMPQRKLLVEMRLSNHSPFLHYLRILL